MGGSAGAGKDTSVRQAAEEQADAREGCFLDSGDLMIRAISTAPRLATEGTAGDRLEQAIGLLMC